VIAAPDALAELKRAFAAHFHHVEEIGFLISNAVSPDGRANCVPAVDERLRDGACAEWSDLLASGLVRIRTSALNSVLIPRGVLATFGIPSPDFQAWGEDTDWSLRVTQTLPAFVVGASRIVHVRGASGELDAATEPDPERIDRFFYLYRNTLYMRRTYWPVQGLVLFLGRAASVAARCLVKAPNRRFRRAWRVLGGTLAGFFFQPRYAPLGKPAEERRDAAAPSRAPRVAAGMRRAFTPPSSGRR
jgi:dTDP-4-dehydrorhamnose reductase